MKLKINYEKYTDIIALIDNDKLKEIIATLFSDLQREENIYNRAQDLAMEQRVIAGIFMRLEHLADVAKRKINCDVSVDSVERAENIIFDIITILQDHKFLGFRSLVSLPLVKQEATEIERKLFAQQKFLVEDEKVNDAFANTLTAIAKYGREITKIYNVAIVGTDEINASYLEWVIPFVKALKDHLKLAGIDSVNIVHFDEAPPGTHYYNFMDQKIESSDVVLLLGTESLLKNYKAAVSKCIHTQLSLIDSKRRKDARLDRPSTIIPVLISGDLDTSFPAGYEQYSFLNFKDTGLYFQNLKFLLATLYKIPREDKKFTAIWNTFLEALPADKCEFLLGASSSSKREVKAAMVEKKEELKLPAASSPSPLAPVRDGLKVSGMFASVVLEAAPSGGPSFVSSNPPGGPALS